MSGLVSPYIAPDGSPESLAAQALVAARNVFISLPHPPGPVAEAFRSARNLMRSWCLWHGSAVVAADRLWFIDDADVLDDIRRPIFPTRMARRGDQNGSRAAVKAAAKPAAEKPPAKKVVPFYTPPVVVREGDFATSARIVDGTLVWSAGTLGKVAGPRTIQAAIAKAKEAVPIMEHRKLFFVLRTRAGGKIAPVSCISLAGLRAIAPHLAPGSKAAKSLRGYLETVG